MNTKRQDEREKRLKRFDGYGNMKHRKLSLHVKHILLDYFKGDFEKTLVDFVNWIKGETKIEQIERDIESTILQYGQDKYFKGYSDGVKSQAVFDDWLTEKENLTDEGKQEFEQVKKYYKDRFSKELERIEKEHSKN